MIGPGHGVPFERIRRITGYLVGTMDQWNDAKKAEERDRVKHAVGCGSSVGLSAGLSYHIGSDGKTD